MGRTLENATHGEVMWAQVDLDAIAHNVRELKKRVGDRVQLMAVIKDDAYGHGAVQVARVALQAGASMLAVARAAEGIQLRRGGIAAPVLLLGYAPATAAASIVEQRLTPTIATLELASALSAEIQQAGAELLPVHVKVDTGMGRFGVMPNEVLDLLRALDTLPGLRLEGLFTHLSTADTTDRDYVLKQLAVFQDVLSEVRAAGFAIPLAHAANSAATIYVPESHFDMVRPGISLYGLQPSAELAPLLPLRPALSLHSRVGRVCALPAGSSVSYGRTHITTRPTRAALVLLGYGDGYHRLISSRGEVLIRGRRCPILGRVCMNQFVVDVTAVADVRLDDEVVMWGRQGLSAISTEEVAGWAQTITNEVLTSLQPRIPRVYLQGGAVLEVQTLTTP